MTGIHHGQREQYARLYVVWCGLRARCRNQRHAAYKNYGGRGIGVNERWDSFPNFVVDVGPDPGREWSLDRPDNDADYGPSNWRWATRATQNRNSRRAKLSVAKAEKIRSRYFRNTYNRSNVNELAEEYNCSRSSVRRVCRMETWADG
jgi:hypothetical protein